MQFKERFMIRSVDIKFADLPIENIGIEKDTCSEVYRFTGLQEVWTPIFVTHLSHMACREKVKLSWKVVK